jgi:hypothetical protein
MQASVRRSMAFLSSSLRFSSPGVSVTYPPGACPPSPHGMACNLSTALAIEATNLSYHGRTPCMEQCFKLA